MDIQIKTNQVRLSEGLEEFIHEKSTRLGRYLPSISHVLVDLTQQKSKNGPDLIIAQITVRHARGAILRAEERTAIEDHDSVKAVFNLAIDKMARRISRFKGKRKDRRNEGDKYIATLIELEEGEEIPDEGFVEAPDAEQQDPLVYRRKIVTVAPMSEEEAIEQMELLGHAFFVFYHPERARVNVLYKRSSGGYGVLDPKLG